MKTIFRHDSWPIQPDILNPRLLRLTSRKQLRQDMQPADIKSHNWRHNWKSAQVVNSHLVWDPTIRQPGFDLPRKQWSLLNHFCTELGLCSACGRKWWLTDIDLSLWWILSSDRAEWQLIPTTLQMKTLFNGWSIMVHDKYTRRRKNENKHYHIETYTKNNTSSAMC